MLIYLFICFVFHLYILHVSSNILENFVDSNYLSGLSQEDQGRIFERFYRADPSRVRTEGEGTGLGLSIVDAVMRAHEGQVSVESKPGEGAIFTLFFPLVH
jgi:signal transduction histidine kinase